MKYFLGLVLVCLVATTSATQLSGLQVFQYSRQVVQQQDLFGADCSVEAVYPWYYQNEVCVYLVDLSPKGFMVFAAENEVAPVLAYSVESDYSAEIHPGMQAYLNNVSAQIKAVRDKGLKASLLIRNQWKSLGQFQAKSKSVSPLMLAEWNQDKFYNDSCPVDTNGPGGRVYAGCVATAMAMIMYYHRYPEQGQGQHGYSSNYGYLSVNYANATYDYDAMVNKIGIRQNPQIAQLQYHCGVALDMGYSPNGSGTFTFLVPYAMSNYYGYDSSIDYITKGSYGSTWQTILKNNLDQGRPMVYNGYPSGGGSGHAFVLDGYQGTDHFHYNWGWGGSYNGYFYLNALNPGTHDFTSGQGAVVNIFPDSPNYPQQCSSQKTLINLEGTFTDGAQTENYQSNADCRWLIAPNHFVSKIRITIDRLDINSGDTLIIYEGPTDSSPIFAKYHQNNIPQFSSDVSQDSVLVVFKTDNQQVDKGFFVSYRGIPGKYCEGIYTFTANTDTLSDGSGQNAYSPGSNCKYEIQPNTGSAIQIDFLEFDLEIQKDYVRVYDNSNSPATLIGHFTGNTLPAQIIVPSNKAMLFFKTNQSVEEQGWKLTYSVLTGLEESENHIDLKVYPNPANEEVNLYLSQKKLEEQYLELLDAKGNLILSRRFVSADYKLNVNLSDLAKGVYFFRLTNSSSSSIRKFVKL